MAGLSIPFGLAALLGKQGPMPAAQAPAAPADVTMPDVTVTGTPFSNKYHEGLIRSGPFSVGQTGGNVLGLLGDALLVGSGHDAIYQPRLQRARESEALIDFADDPMRAISQMSQVNPDKAQKLYNDYVSSQNDTSRTASLNRAAEQAFENNIHQRALSFLGAATPDSLPGVVELIKKYYTDSGVTPMFNLDDVHSVDDAIRLASGAVDVKDQRKLAEDRRYHDAVIAQDRVEEGGRNRRESMQQEGANQRNREDNATSRANTQDRVAAQRGISKPKLNIKTRPDGTRYVVRDN